MGLFSSRRADPSSLPANHDVVPSSSLPDKSVTQLIRSRFIGRGNRRGQPEPLHSVDGAQSLDSNDEMPLHRQDHSYRSYRGVDQSQLPKRPYQLHSHRTSTDAITMTLAHRLNELATANADGLLNDDDYRVLRQNLFKTFASISAPPAEVPVVKSVEPVSLRLSSVSRSDGMTMNPARSPSLRTQTSIGSSMSSLFQRVRRWTSEKHNIKEQDQMSVVSSSSRMPLSLSTALIPQDLRRQASNSSLKTTRSRHMPPDLRSISSRWSMKSSGTSSDTGGMSRGSTRSFRGSEPPPSSFNAKHLASPVLSSDGDEDRLRSAADIRAEIRITEAEEQRVVAAFSLLTRQRFDATFPGHTQVSDFWTFVPRHLPSTSILCSDRKQSITGTRPADMHLVLDETSLVSQGHNVSTLRCDRLGISAEMQPDEVDRRRADVSMRYQQRLDYLRARLKGAEIHERLLRK